MTDGIYIICAHTHTWTCMRSHVHAHAHTHTHTHTHSRRSQEYGTLFVIFLVYVPMVIALKAEDVRVSTCTHLQVHCCKNATTIHIEDYCTSVTFT